MSEMEEKPKYRYKALHDLNPSLYDKAWNLSMAFDNMVFCMKNIGSISSPTRFTNSSIKKEYFDIRKKLDSLLEENQNSEHSRATVVSDMAGLIEYSVVRASKPDIVVETGVANGYSTAVILSALEKNTNGKLVSVEISKNVGRLVDMLCIGKERWELVVGKPRENLVQALDREKRIDIFIHDSDHSYENMKFEFQEAYKRIRDGGFLMSDDIFWNKKSAFVDFSRAIGAKPSIFPSSNKSFGIIKINKKQNGNETL